jgi:lipopolysaccharide heptosyltransferase II
LRLSVEQTSETKSIQAVPTILLILVAGIGDFVLATRAIRAVRSGHPGAAIHLLTSSEGAVFARRYSGIDRVFAFPIRELRGQRFPVRPFVDVLRQLRRTRYDIAANFYPVCSWAGSARMALLFSLIRARLKAGHAHGFMRLLLDTHVPERVFFSTHRVNAMTEVACAIGGRDDDLGIEVPVADGKNRWNGLVAPHIQGHAGKLIGINPGGDRANRRWPAANFAALACELAGQIGARILIFGGPGEESAAAAIHQSLNGAAVNLVGQLALHELPYFLSRCDLLITNDSGPMHIAAALKVPVVALFGPESPALFGPCSSPERSRVLQKSVPCRPCPHTSCAQPICLQGIYPSEVLAASLDLLKTASSMNAADRNLKAG